MIRDKLEHLIATTIVVLSIVGVVSVGIVVMCVKFEPPPIDYVTREQLDSLRIVVDKLCK